MQDAATPQKKQKSDIVGYEFVLMDDISRAMPGSHRYSGIDWKVEVDSSSEVDALAKGSRVVVVSVDVGLFRVKKLA
jgi:membrane protein implicated in regulation of membrane protease activity